MGSLTEVQQNLIIGSLLGDGSIRKKIGAHFELEEQQTLIGLLKQTFGIQSTVNRDKKYFRIRMRVESIPLFRSITTPYILPEFMYKFPQDPVSTDPRIIAR